ncbi:hypothetical protein GDO81_004421 [Engystomops pustulosus]|uniref:CHCH domain-containing protein n=1 Tax=Engystomops pustulosus TaxID=76066 RepID=A0AAV6ZXZ9_ENGPU|nr:hypothetical protein GDO81_004421 [Engystomops pustulosus]
MGSPSCSPSGHWRWQTPWLTGEATCITEMSVLMACWKENAFSDTACSNPVKDFYECVAREQKARKLGAKEEKPEGWMPPQQVNKLLRKYPNIKHEI